MVIWVTGLSAAGKTTLCRALEKLVKPRLPQFVHVDGEAVRAAFGGNLGYREADRVVQIKRLQRLAKILAEQDLVVVVGALYSHPDLLAWNRENLPGYFEVYIEAPYSLLRERDPKGIYSGADAGAMSDVVGIDIPWHAPVDPDMVIDAAKGEPAALLAKRVVRAIPALAKVFRVVSA